MTKKISLVAIGAGVALALGGTALAEDEYNVTSGNTLGGAPLGVHGVDPVALSTLGAVAPGSAEHTVTHDGIAYYFASALSAKTFKAAPEKYLPQYGGYCALGVALGIKLDGDPRFADIVDGKLYLFVNEEIYEKYEKSKRGTIRKADRTWPSVHHKAVADL